MKPRHKSLASLSLLLLVSCTFATGLTLQSQSERHSAEFHSMQQKIAYLRANAAKTRPDPKPVDLTEHEVNAYFNEGGVKLPKGVSDVQLSSQPGVIEGHAQVNFDAIMQSSNPMNPLLGLFSGVHDVHAVAQAAGSSGTGSIRVQSVSLDGIEVPQMALEFFVKHYLTPKYPNVGTTSTFKLPLRIDSAVVDSGRVRLLQK